MQELSHSVACISVRFVLIHTLSSQRSFRNRALACAGTSLLKNVLGGTASPAAQSCQTMYSARLSLTLLTSVCTPDHAVLQVSKKTGKLPASLRASVTASANLDSTGRPSHRPKRPATTTLAQQQQQQQHLLKTAPAGSTFLPPLPKCHGSQDKSSAAAALVDGGEGGGTGLGTQGLGTTNSAGYQVGHRVTTTCLDTRFQIN